MCSGISRSQQFRRKRRGLLSFGLCLQLENARPPTARHTVKQIQDLKVEVLSHPSYSSDLAPSDSHLFWPLKGPLRGRHFNSDEVEEAVQGWLAQQPKDFFT